MISEDYEITFSGVYKDCPMCGKHFFVPDTSIWVYRRAIRKGSKTHLYYFDKWSCLSKFEREYEIIKQENRAESIERSMRNRKLKKKHLCFECAYNKENDDGKHFCELDISRYVFPKKESCRQFCIKEELKDGSN